jgi:hypothetical protein
MTHLYNQNSPASTYRTLPLTQTLCPQQAAARR